LLAKAISLKKELVQMLRNQFTSYDEFVRSWIPDWEGASDDSPESILEEDGGDEEDDEEDEDDDEDEEEDEDEEDDEDE